jgi:DNA replication protein DnaC
MTTESQTTIQESIESITAKYVGKALPVSKSSRREQYREQWQTSPITQGVDIEKVDFSYDIMRIALHFAVTQKLKAKGKTFTINADNAKRLKRILMAITGDITGDYDTNKGIFMYGPPSSGKTFIMQSICHVLTKAFYTKWYTLTSPAYFYNYKDITLKAREQKSIDFLRTYFDHRDIIFLDDLGYDKENMINLMGTKENMVPHLIDVLYRKYLEGVSVHITSNLPLEFIKTEFGDHTHDRIVDMCTPVSWMGDNFRTG